MKLTNPQLAWILVAVTSAVAVSVYVVNFVGRPAHTPATVIQESEKQ